MLAEKLANLRRGVLNAQAECRPIQGAELGILADNLEALARRVAELERHAVPASARPPVDVDDNVVDLTRRRVPRLAPSPDSGSAA